MINYKKLFIVMLLVLVTSISAINAADISGNETSLDSLSAETSTDTHITNDDKQIESSTQINTDDNNNIIKKENKNIKSKDSTRLIIDEPSKKFELQNGIEITGALKDSDNDDLDYESIEIFVDGVLDKQIDSDKYGKFTYQYKPSTVGTYSIQAVYVGSNDYYPSESDVVNITVISGTDIIFDEISDQNLNTSTKISGKLVDIIGNGIENQIITFKDKTGNVLGTTTTSNQTEDIGNFTLDYIPRVPGQIEIIASFDGTEYYTNTTQSTTLNVIGAMLFLDEVSKPLSIAQPTITGRLITSNQTLTDVQKIHIYVNDNYNGITTADANGNFKFTLDTTDSIHPVTIGNYTVHAESYEYPYPDLKSNTINITINNPRNITLDQSTIETKINTSTNITGKLTSDDGTIQSDKTIYLKNNNETIATTTTDENGTFTLEVTITTPQTIQYNVTFESEDEYESASTPVTLNVDDIPTLTINVLTDGIYTAPIISGKLVLSNGSALLNQQIHIYIDKWYDGKINSVGEDGTFEYTLTTDNLRAGEHVVTAKTFNSPYPDIESNNITVKYVCGVTIEAEPVDLNMSIYQPAKIRGNLSAQDGALLSGETLTLSNDGIFMNTTKVNDDESFTFNFTPTQPGLQKYSVGIQSEYYEGLTTIYLNIADVGELTLNNATKPVLITEATIKGILKSLTGKFISGQKIEVYVNDWYNGKVTTSEEDGTFTYKLNTTADYKLLVGENKVKVKTPVSGGNYSGIESNEIVITLISPTTIKLDETKIDNNNTPEIDTRNNTLTRITGQLLDYYDYGIEKQTIILKQGNETITTALTGDDGKFTLEVTPQVIGTTYYEVIYEGADLYSGSTANVKLEVRSETTLTIDEIKNPVYLNEKVNITGKLVDSEGNGVKNQPINLYINNIYLYEVTNTSSQAGKEGTFTYETTFDETGKYNISAEFFGPYHYDSSKSNLIEFIVKDKTRIEYDVLNDVEEKTAIAFYVYDSKGNLIKDAKVDLSGDITESDVLTVMVYKNPSISAGNYTVTVKYNGTDVYNQSTKEFTLTIKEDPTKVNEKLEEQIKDLNKTIQTLNNTNNNLTKQLEDALNKLEKLNNTLNNLTNTNKNLTTQLQDAQKQIQTLTQENTNLNNQLQNANQKITNLTNQLKTANSTIQNLTNTINNLTKQLEQKENNIENLTEQLKQSQQTIETLNNTINKLTQPPLKTTITIQPIKSSIGSITKITANILDENGNKVTGGKAIFKINGMTIKDETGNTIYGDVKNGIASINYKVQNTWIKNTTYVEAVYSGDVNYTSSRTKQTDVLNITKGKATITLDKKNITTKPGQTITLRAKVLDTNGDHINRGKVLFKLNGITLKDAKGNALMANVIDGEAVLDYTIPATYSAKTYTLTAVFADNYYQRAENNGTVKLDKKAIIITPNTVTTTNKKTTVKATITDETGKALVKSTPLAIKVNGITMLSAVNSNNGTINVSFNNTLKPGMYELLIISGETGLYLPGKTTTVLKI